MPEYYLKKTWGFDTDDYPLIGFSTSKAQRTFIELSNHEDWVLVVATKTEESQEDIRGRLLGMARLGTSPIDTEALLKQIGTPIKKNHINKQGGYKWPYGLPILEAYTFDDTPLIEDVIGVNPVGYVWAGSARSVEMVVGLVDDYRQRIESLNKTSVTIKSVPALDKERARKEFYEYQNRMNAPAPITERSASTTAEGNPVTYLLKMIGLTGKEVFKVGFSTNIDRRLKELNSGLVTAVTGLSWEVLRVQPLMSGLTAYTYEQLIHRKLRLGGWLVPGTTEIYQMREKDILSSYIDVLSEFEFMMPQVMAEYAENYDELMAADNKTY